MNLLTLIGGNGIVRWYIISIISCKRLRGVVECIVEYVLNETFLRISTSENFSMCADKVKQNSQN